MGTTKKFSDYVHIKEAAEILGVSPSTIRNWARAGKLPEHRHPVNEYRLFDRADLQDLLDRVRQPHATDGSRRPSQERSA